MNPEVIVLDGADNASPSVAPDDLASKEESYLTPAFQALSSERRLEILLKMTRQARSKIGRKPGFNDSRVRRLSKACAAAVRGFLPEGAYVMVTGEKVGKTCNRSAEFTVKVALASHDADGEVTQSGRECRYKEEVAQWLSGSSKNKEEKVAEWFGREFTDENRKPWTVWGFLRNNTKRPVLAKGAKGEEAEFSVQDVAKTIDDE